MKLGLFGGVCYDIGVMAETVLDAIICVVVDESGVGVLCNAILHGDDAYRGLFAISKDAQPIFSINAMGAVNQTWSHSD